MHRDTIERYRHNKARQSETSRDIYCVCYMHSKVCTVFTSVVCSLCQVWCVGRSSEFILVQSVAASLSVESSLCSRPSVTSKLAPSTG